MPCSRAMTTSTPRPAGRDALRARGVSVMLCLVGLLVACSPDETTRMPQYASQATVRDPRQHWVFAVHPLYNPQLLHQKYMPLMHYLDRSVPDAVFDLDTSADYAGFEAKLMSGRAAFSLPNPYEAIQSWAWGYHVFAKMAGDDDFRGVFIVRKDSPVKVPQDLIGRAVAYPAPSALAATMATQLYLQDHGVDVQSQLANRFVGTHNSVLMNTYLGQSAVGATSPRGWEAFQKANPREAADMRPLWQTPPLVQNPVMARADVPPGVQAQVRNALVRLRDTAEGRQLLLALDTPGFDPAEDAQYRPIQTFVQAFNSRVKKQR